MKLHLVVYWAALIGFLSWGISGYIFDVPYLFDLATFKNITGENAGTSPYSVAVILYGIHKIWPIGVLAVFVVSLTNVLSAKIRARQKSNKGKDDA